MKKPILVIGDIHNRWAQAETILQSLKGRYRKAILLGDYWDDFGDTPDDAAATARWFARSLAEPDRIHLLGNHDLPYLFPQNSHLYCPGFSWEKQVMVERELASAPRERLMLAHAEDGWLFSHAGFSPEYAASETPASMAHKANALVPTLHEDYYQPMLACGAGRGGRELVGGITWIDWWCEFKPIPGLNQIVGHTPTGLAKAQLLRDSDDLPAFINATIPRIHRYRVKGKSRYASVNWCLDCRLSQVALVGPDRIEIVDAGACAGATNFSPI